MNFAVLLVLLFLAVTFLQSGYDKIMDWQGNVGWLKGHFSSTFIRNQVPSALGVVLVLEMIAGILCLVGVVENLMGTGTVFGLSACVLSCVTLGILLFGQRIAKDYDGARTIVIYFMPALFGVYLLQ